MVDTKSVLHKNVINQAAKIGRADILVGIPSYRSAATIVNVVKAISSGLAKYFPKLSAVVVDSDGGSDDNTREKVLKTSIAPNVIKIVTAYKGVPGKGSAFHTIFEIADMLDAKVCILVDSDLRSITPEWMRLLGEPILKADFDFVAPFYARHKYDGTITNSIAYPLTRALYGRIVRQPIGGEFALSGSLAKVCARQNTWKGDIARFGIDIWLTTTAICEGFRICQASMGAKLHDQKDPGCDLKPMFQQVIGTALALMRKYESKWQAVQFSQPVDLFKSSSSRQPEPVKVDVKRLLECFYRESKECREVFAKVLSPDNLSRARRLMVDSNNEIAFFPDRLWARIVYDHAVAYNFNHGLSKDDIVASLMAFYFGRTASFVIRTRAMAVGPAEKTVSQTARVFEEEKPYLLKRWEAAKADVVKAGVGRIV